MSLISFRRRALVAGLASALAFAPALSARADPPPLTVENAWARINLGDRPSAGYARIKNAGTEADRLIAARSPAFGRIELHTHQMVDGVMRMRAVDGIEAPAGQTIALEPGGLHLMLFDPTGRLVEGDRFAVTLTFERAGPIVIEATARGLASGAPDGAAAGEERPHAHHGAGHDAGGPSE